RPGGQLRTLEQAGAGAPVLGGAVDGGGGRGLVERDGGEPDQAVLELQPGGLLVGDEVDVDLVEPGGAAGPGGVADQVDRPAGRSGRASAGRCGDRPAAPRRT